MHIPILHMTIVHRCLSIGECKNVSSSAGALIKALDIRIKNGAGFDFLKRIFGLLLLNLAKG